jgi:riboflavin synthase
MAVYNGWPIIHNPYSFIPNSSFVIPNYPRKTMFTGIIEELGTLVERKAMGTSLCLKIEAERVFHGSGPLGPEIQQIGLKIDDSISINGVCQTVTSVSPPFFEVIAVRETLQKTTLRSLIVGQASACRVNLERAATLQTRLGGHLVSGHVDGRARVTEIRDLDGSWEFFFELPKPMARYVIPMGSITLDGVSLTVAEVVDGVLSTTIKTAIIPHTYYYTNFQNLSVGDEVNVELDQIAKMVERLMV